MVVFRFIFFKTFKKHCSYCSYTGFLRQISDFKQPKTTKKTKKNNPNCQTPPKNPPPLEPPSAVTGGRLRPLGLAELGAAEGGGGDAALRRGPLGAGTFEGATLLVFFGGGFSFCFVLFCGFLLVFFFPRFFLEVGEVWGVGFWSFGGRLVVWGVGEFGCFLGKGIRAGGRIPLKIEESWVVFGVQLGLDMRV